ncbi:DUF3025 domain-containing protein [Pigmentiphaga soli]|uniref:DUF3025 domain-containing protein n=1 Tax=Pigmentiphaga soli TaxID=1007095 RepID=A0ABP8HQ96_9BURK
MASGELNPVDWNRPWFASVAAVGERLPHDDGAPLCDRLNMLLRAERGERVSGTPSRLKMDSGKPVLFVPPSDLPPGTAYETHVHDTGRIPTRDNLHDLFNGLMWFAFPHIKSRLNAIQARELKRQAAGAAPASQTGARGAVRDAVTVFDENGLVLACSNDELAQALRRFDWRTLFIERRTATLMQTEPWVVGHALLEKLMQPYKGITAHALIVPVDDSYFRASNGQRRATIDRLVSDWLENWPFFTTRDLAPLPVLGLPGWWPANTQPAFYDDSEVFRPGRVRRK